MANYTVKFTAGDVLFRQGSLSDVVYRIKSGDFVAYTESKQEQIKLSQMKPGDFFGELGVLQGTPRNATVRATSAAEVEVFTKEEFLSLIVKDPEASIKLIHMLCLRNRTLMDLVAQLNASVAQKRASSFSFFLSLFNFIEHIIGSTRRKVTDELFAPTSVQSLEDVPLTTRTIALEKGETLCTEGEAGPCAYLLKSGDLAVYKNVTGRKRFIGSIVPGQFVGELGLLAGTPRTATVSAKSASRLEVFDENEMIEFLFLNSLVRLNMIHTLSYRATSLAQLVNRLMTHTAPNLENSALLQARLLLQSVEDVYQLSGQVIERDIKRLQKALSSEASSVREMFNTYQKFLRNQASAEEMAAANSEFRNQLKVLGIGALFFIPGSIITIPLVVKAAKSFGFDLLPKMKSH